MAKKASVKKSSKKSPRKASPKPRASVPKATKKVCKVLVPECLAKGLVPKRLTVRQAGLSPKKQKRTGPKRKLTAYNIFVRDNFAKVRGAGQPAKEVIVELGAKWKALSASEKAKYVAKAK